MCISIVVPNISPNDRIPTNISPFLDDSNILIFAFVKKIWSEYIHIHICQKNINPSIFVFVFANNVDPNIFGLIFWPQKNAVVTHCTRSWAKIPFVPNFSIRLSKNKFCCAPKISVRKFCANKMFQNIQKKYKKNPKKVNFSQIVHFCVQKP